jgi:plastocyanin
MASRLTLLLLLCVAGCAAVLAPSAAGTQPTATKSARHRVAVKDDFFSPKTIRIHRGATVTWVVRGVDGHTVTFKKIPKGAARIKGTGVMDKGARFSHKFTKRGTYNYVCRIHVSFGMKGRVIVG